VIPPRRREPFRGLRTAHYGAILADPPWSFRSWGGKTGTPHRGAHDHYATTPEAALAALPVAELTRDDCALFMWAIDSHLDEALRLGAAWGFTYKTRVFEWLKLTSTGKIHFGMGYWTRKQSESCLLFTQGNPRRKSKGVRQLIQAPVREHSRKPEEQYQKIESLVDGPYAELFSRRRRPGWDGWGLEHPK
jgi:N6-adenosine-specific RNA methylase IME4